MIFFIVLVKPVSNSFFPFLCLPLFRWPTVPVLMSLDKADAVPVDTHVWQIAKRDYKCAAGSAQKTLTDKVHRDIGQHEFNRLQNVHS